MFENLILAQFNPNIHLNLIWFCSRDDFIRKNLKLFDRIRHRDEFDIIKNPKPYLDFFSKFLIFKLFAEHI